MTEEMLSKRTFRRGVRLFIIVALGVIIVSGMLVEYISYSLKVEKSRQTPQEVKAQEQSFMSVVQEGRAGSAGGGNVFYRVLVDEETGVMYYAEYKDYPEGGSSIIPLYNADGTLRIYKGD